jgi:hypothetical protein
MRETVLGETPAALATIPSVTVPEPAGVEAVAGERLRREGGWVIGGGSARSDDPAV